MERYIALLRGINVSGQKLIKMAELLLLFKQLKFENCTSYLQSGNIVFDSNYTDENELKINIENAINKHFGYDVPVMIRMKKNWTSIIQNNPFVSVKFKDISFLHVGFLEKNPEKEQLSTFQNFSSLNDELEIIGKEIYLYCPDGYGKTKLNNAFFEKKLKMNCTTRNWKTVLALQNL